jgi:hypothetical protein
VRLIPFREPEETLLASDGRSVALTRLGHRLDTDDDVKRVCVHEGLEPEDLDKHLNGFG